MTDYQKYINALRKCAKEHENDRTFTGHIIVSDLCKDTANLLETLEQQSNEDAVSRTLVHEAITASIAESENPYEMWQRIEALPSVTPQPMTESEDKE